MRIEINLSDEVIKELQKKADALNQSRKAYIELLCINDTKKVRGQKSKK